MDGSYDDQVLLLSRRMDNAGKELKVMTGYGFSILLGIFKECLAGGFVQGGILYSVEGVRPYDKFFFFRQLLQMLFTEVLICLLAVLVDVEVDLGCDDGP